MPLRKRRGIRLRAEPKRHRTAGSPRGFLSVVHLSRFARRNTCAVPAPVLRGSLSVQCAGSRRVLPRFACYSRCLALDSDGLSGFLLPFAFGSLFQLFGGLLCLFDSFCHLFLGFV